MFQDDDHLDVERAASIQTRRNQGGADAPSLLLRLDRQGRQPDGWDVRATVDGDW
jgi:hypothetical protein